MGLRSGSQGIFKHIRRLIRSFPGRADRQATAKHSFADNRMPVGVICKAQIENYSEHLEMIAQR